MKKQIFFAFVLSLIVVVALAACGGGSISPASSGGGLDGKALTESRCTACHGLNRVEQKRKASAWPGVVDQMISRGANLNSDEKAAVINYLSTNFSQ